MSDRNEKIQTIISDALADYDGGSPRTQQSRAGILGPSDIGFCRQKAVLVTKQVQPTDNPSKWAAMVGTALHNYIEAAIKQAHPDWLVGSIDKIRVTATLPSGAEISGSPDIVVPSSNAVLDIKTVDGFEWVQRNGTSSSHKYQRHLYAMGLVDAGILDGSRPVVVGNLYFDRSGKEPEPLVLTEELDPTLTREIDSWVTDVIYAVTHGQDASRDVAAAVCQRICEFFTVCRGGELAVHEGSEIIQDPYLITAIDTYLEGDALEKKGKKLKAQAKQELVGVNGVTDAAQVRWVHVNPTVVPETSRAGYDRLDVRLLKKSS